MSYGTAELRMPGDGELVSRVQRGDESAFGELYSRHRPNCLRLALSILHNLSDAEEQVQEAFWNAYRHIRRLRDSAQFATWLNRIVINVCLMRIRSMNRRRLVSLDEPQSGVNSRYRELPDPRPSPECAFRETEFGNVLRTEIQRIPSALRTVLQLKYVEDRTTEEAARIMGITASAAKSRSVRARRELKRRLSTQA